MRGCILKNFKSIKLKMAAYRPLFTSAGLLLRNIMKTSQDSYTITIKQIVRFQHMMHLEKFQVDKIQNSCLSAIIHLNRPDIVEYQDSYTITIKQIVRFQERMHFKNFNSIKFKMAANRPLFTFTWPIFGKPC